MLKTGVPPLELHRGVSGIYTPQLSIWQLVTEYVKPHEHEEIKQILGVSLVDKSLELQEEAEMLMSILDDYKEETNTVRSMPTLPEPPQQRDRLVCEISFLVENIRDKAKSQGMNADQVLSKHNGGVIDYALESSRTSSRPSSSSSNTPRILSPVMSDGEVRHLTSKLNYLNMDDVIHKLRTALEEEIESLLQGISTLQEGLDSEATFRDDRSPLSREPTLTELKEERSSLERVLLSQEHVPVVLTKMKPNFEVKSAPRVQVSRAAVFQTPVHQRGPVRALHNLSPDLPQGKLPVAEVLLNDSVQQTVIRKRTLSANRVKVVPVGSIFSPEKRTQDEATFLPSPPSTANGVSGTRPSSADRFRKFVIGCRDGN